MFENIIFDDYSNSAIILTIEGSIQVCFESLIEPQYNGMVLTDDDHYTIY